jgi:hypothetical protein
MWEQVQELYWKIAWRQGPWIHLLQPYISGKIAGWVHVNMWTFGLFLRSKSFFFYLLNNHPTPSCSHKKFGIMYIIHYMLINIQYIFSYHCTPNESYSRYFIKMILQNTYTKLCIEHRTNIFFSISNFRGLAKLHSYSPLMFLLMYEHLPLKGMVSQDMEAGLLMVSVDRYIL